MAAAIEVDTLQGVLGGSVWFHLDLSNDVLYLRTQVNRNDRVFGEETTTGLTELRTDRGDLAGMTVVNYWKRYGVGSLVAASIQSVQDQVAEWAKQNFLLT